MSFIIKSSSQATGYAAVTSPTRVQQLTSRYHSWKTRRGGSSRYFTWWSVAATGVALLLAHILAPANAQTPSSQPIRFEVAFAPGGGADLVARIIADQLNNHLGQKIVVENRPGAAGVIAARQVTGAGPETPSVLVASNPLLINQIIRPDTDFEIAKELIPLASVAPQQIVIVCNPQLPIKSLKELMDLGRTRNLNYGTTGTGSLSHLAVAYLLMSQSGIKMQHVPFTGASPALTAVMAGQVEVGSSTVPPALPLIKSGKLRALAVAGDKRSAMLPNVPTFAQAGFPSLSTLAWTGFFTSAKTSKVTAARISKLILEAAAMPEARAKFAELGFEPQSYGMDDFSRQLAAELHIWTDVVNKLNLVSRDK